MGVSPGTGAGIGIACALILLFIAGPVAYRNRKKKHLQEQQSRPTDLETADKPQLANTEVSSPSWRASGMNATAQWAPEMATHHDATGLGIDVDRSYQRPISEAAGSEAARYEGSQIAEVDASGQRERAELGHTVQSPRPVELRADLPTPASSPSYPEPTRLLESAPTRGSRYQHVANSLAADDTCPTSGLPDVSTLPGPLLPPQKPPH